MTWWQVTERIIKVDEWIIQEILTQDMAFWKERQYGLLLPLFKKSGFLGTHHQFGGTWNPKGRGAYFDSAVWDDSSKGEQLERTARSFKLSATYVLWTIPIQHSLAKDRRGAISSYLAFTMNIQ